MYDFMTLFAENVTEVDFDAERDAIVKFYSTFTPPPANKLQVIARSSRVQLLAFFGVACAVAQMLIPPQLAEAVAKAIVEDMAVLHNWYTYYNSKYAAAPALLIYICIGAVIVLTTPSCYCRRHHRRHR